MFRLNHTRQKLKSYIVHPYHHSSTLFIIFSTDINLKQRIENLSRAIICIKSAEVSVMDTSYHTPNSGGIGSGELLHELEEKMEVARVQLQLVDAISNMRRTPDVETSISKVNLSIYNSASRQCQYN